MGGSAKSRRPEGSEVAQVLAELQTSNRLLAVIATKGTEQPKAIAFLDSLGFEPKGIAAALGITSNAVSIALYRQRKAVDAGPAVLDEKRVSPDDNK